MNLRPYQTDLIQLTREVFKKGYKRPLVVLPCGGGKTVCFAYMAQQHTLLATTNYVWFLVHRRELITQTLSTFKAMGIPHDRIYIGMIGTALKHPTPPTLIIFDEAHHATARTWQRVIEAYPSVPVVGLTATPKRLNGEALDMIFDTLVDSVSAESLIDNGYLAPYEYYAPRLPVDLTDIPIIGADYDQAVVADRFERAKIYGDIAKYIDPARKTIIYAPTIAFSQSLAANIKGVVHFDGNTPVAERDRIIKEFRDGTIRCLTNVNLIGEGFDVPDCDTVILARPTQSLSLYIQQSMRCMRYQDNKVAIVYDMVGNAYRHGMPTEQRMWTLAGRIKPKHTTEQDVIVRECRACFRVYKGNASVCPYCGNDNGKTKQQIKIEADAALQRITEVKRTERRKARTLDDLKRIELERGYKKGWAYRVFNARRRNV